MTTATIDSTQVDGLVAQLAGYPDAAVRGLAKKAGLPSHGGQSKALERFGSALADGRLSPDDLEALLGHLGSVTHLVEGLAGHRDAALKGFARRGGLAATGDRHELLDRILFAMTDGELPHEELSKFLRWLERMDQLVERLAEHPDAIVEELSREHGLPLTGKRQTTIAELADALHSGRVRPEELDQFLRDLTPRLLERLDRYPPAALEGLANETRLALTGARGGATLVEAAESGQVSSVTLSWFLEDLGRKDEAVAQLSRFAKRLAPAREYCDSVGLRRAGTLEVLHGRIRDALFRGAVPLRTLIDFLDEKRENGHQHVRLFQIDPSQEAYLHELKNPRYLEQRMAELGCENCLASPRYIEQTDEPALASVAYRDSQELVCKWVETRFRLDNGVPVRQRAVTFFRVDLERGGASLRVQWFDRDRKQQVQRSMREYAARVATLIDLERFSPLLIEPAVRYLLTSDTFEVTRWTVQRGGGESLKGTGGAAGFLHNLLLAFQTSFAVDVQGRWQRRFRVKLDGRSDVLDLPWESDAEELPTFLGEVREQVPVDESGDGPGLPESLAKRDALLKVRQLLTQRGRQHLPVKAIEIQAKSSVLTRDAFLEAIEEGMPGFEELANVSFHVRCPLTGHPILRKSSILEFPQSSKVPPKVACDHHRGGRRFHPTEANLLLYFPEFEPPAPQWRKLWPLMLLIGMTTVISLAFGVVLNLGLGQLPNTLVLLGFALALVSLVYLMSHIMGWMRFWQAVGEVKRLWITLFDPANSLLGRVAQWLWDLRLRFVKRGARKKPTTSKKRRTQRQLTRERADTKGQTGKSKRPKHRKRDHKQGGSK